MKATKLLLSMAVLLALGSACDLVLPPVLQGCPSEEGFDFGDAPDPTYPSLLASDGARTEDITQLWLGGTEEPSADTERDSRQVDQDCLDDGLESLNNGVLRFRLVKSASASAGVVYFNLLVDANNDGSWIGEDEWVVVNEEVELAPGESRVLEVRILRPLQNVWMRAALTDTPVPELEFPNGWDGTGQFKRGEIEDYFITVFLPEIPTPTETPTYTPTTTATPTYTPTPTPTPTHTPTPTPTPTYTPTPTATPTPKFILTGISVTHQIRDGKVHFWVHVRDQAYDGQIYGKEIYFDGVLVERFMYDFWILPHCQPSEVDIKYQGNPPEVIEFHFLRRDGSNLGSVFSQPATTGMGKSVPGAGLPPPRPSCVYA